MEKLVEEFIDNWNSKGFSRNGDTVLLTCSGGIDSMVLAHLLLESGFSFAVAHVNFSLRAEDSVGDASFVRQWCEKHKLVYHDQVFDTARYATEAGLSTQMAARELRYQWFEQLRLEHHYSAILTAHHQDDVTETVLIHLLRGTGIAGLHGIPERNGKIIRPLLFTNRASILTYAQAQSITWREDVSNASNKYLRNSLRNEIIPQLEKLVPGSSARMAETAERIRETELLFREALEHRKRKLLEHRGPDIYIPIKLLRKEVAIGVIAYELLSPYGFTADQIEGVLRLLEGSSGKYFSSPSHRIFRDRDFLILTVNDPANTDLIQVLEIPAVIHTQSGSFSFSWVSGDIRITDDNNTALLNGDFIQWPLNLRRRREGDYFYPLGMGMKKKKLKRFLIDMKVPQPMKERMYVLESNQRMVWIPGLRIDERFKVVFGGGRVLKVEYFPEL